MGSERSADHRAAWFCPDGNFFEERDVVMGQRGFGNKGLIDELVKNGQGQWGEEMGCSNEKHGNRVTALACVLLYAGMVW